MNAYFTLLKVTEPIALFTLECVMGEDSKGTGLGVILEWAVKNYDKPLSR
jgi:hypothetical protein